MNIRTCTSRFGLRRKGRKAKRHGDALNGDRSDASNVLGMATEAQKPVRTKNNNNNNKNNREDDEDGENLKEDEDKPKISGERAEPCASRQICTGWCAVCSWKKERKEKWANATRATKDEREIELRLRLDSIPFFIISLHYPLHLFFSFLYLLFVFYFFQDIIFIAIYIKIRSYRQFTFQDVFTIFFLSPFSRFVSSSHFRIRNFYYISFSHLFFSSQSPGPRLCAPVAKILKIPDQRRPKFFKFRQISVKISKSKNF